MPNTPQLQNSQNKPRPQGKCSFGLRVVGCLRSHTQQCHGDVYLRKLINVGR